MAARLGAVTDRRSFLGASAALLLAACGEKGEAPLPPGELLSTQHALGHRLRDGGLPAPKEKRSARVVIVGAGIGGLSAAWRLRRAGFEDFTLLELEHRPGGNARWGENEVSAYPWGAHYIPVPSVESRATRLLLAELGVLEGNAEAATPRYAERALVQAPQERHYRNGSWSEGIVPLEGRSAAEADDWHRFQVLVRRYQALRGRDGKRAFAIPLDHSSRDAELLALDRMPMDAWLRAQQLTSETVHWVVNYGCRDDYGCDYRNTSAWAGLHYFCCRGGRSETDHDAVLTWPEGNGWVVRRLMERYAFSITPDAMVFRVEEDAKGVTLAVFLATEQRAVEIRAERVIWAAPFGLAAAVFADRELAGALRTYDYAPWITANLTLAEPPLVGHGAPLSWDNVICDSPSLGYVVATHQSLASHPGPTVLTWYMPLTTEAPLQGRKRLLSTLRDAWASAALREISRPHPEIRELTRRIDIFANGHAMVLPRPGVIWGDARKRITGHRGRVHFAHADASGLSLFEEANDRGVMAAESVLAAMGSKQESFRFRV